MQWAAPALLPAVVLLQVRARNCPPLLPPSQGLFLYTWGDANNDYELYMAQREAGIGNMLIRCWLGVKFRRLSCFTVQPGCRLCQQHMPVVLPASNRNVGKAGPQTAGAVLRHPNFAYPATFADAIIMDDVEKLAKARKKQASLFATKPLRSPASAQVGTAVCIRPGCMLCWLVRCALLCWDSEHCCPVRRVAVALLT